MFVDLPCQNSKILLSFEKYIIYGFYMFFGKALTVCWVFSTSKKFEFLQIRKKMMMMNYNMKTRILFIIIGCFVVYASEKKVQEKEEASTVPLGNTLSPPEGNTTFMGGTTWCVALPGASQSDLQIALDWACGAGMADCNPINRGGVCFEPDTLVSHASYAFNNYYQQNGNNDIACNFGGTATLTKQDPSYGKCSYSVSGPSNAATSKLNPQRKMTSILLLLLLLYLTTYFAW